MFLYVCVHACMCVYVIGVKFILYSQGCCHLATRAQTDMHYSLDIRLINLDNCQYREREGRWNKFLKRVTQLRITVMMLSK